MKAKNVILSASSATYFHFLQGLILSLEEKSSHSEPFDCAVFDLGLLPDQIQWLESHHVQHKPPHWEFGLTDTSGLSMPYKAVLAKPFIPKYFPGYDKYLHIDADAWVQDPVVISHYFEAIEKASIAIAPELDRSYGCCYKDSNEYRDFVKEVFLACRGEDYVHKYLNYPILNAGIFALPASSRIWDQWKDELEISLKKTHHHAVEQTSLNIAIFDNYLISDPNQIQLMPATHNWLCHLCFPLYDEQKKQWVHPYTPHEKIGILHRSSDAFKTSEFVPITSLQGTSLSMNFLFQEGSYKSATTEKKGAYDWQQRKGKKF